MSNETNWEIHLSTKDRAEVGEIVIYRAEDIFERCSASSDFCIQSIHENCVIFGSTNRLKFSAKFGWVPERSYCTPGFLEKYDKLIKENV